MESIHIRLILEILGKPSTHVHETLSALVDKLGGEKGVRITHKNVHEPVLVKDSKDLFTSFAEVEAEFDSLNVFFGIIFAYMPSNIEIISPSSFTLSNEFISTVGNSLIGRLHMYESITKKLVSDRDVLLNRLRAMTKPAEPQGGIPTTLRVGMGPADGKKTIEKKSAAKKQKKSKPKKKG